ncbi:MAG TPA: phage terminase large subunit family protein [Candidatus Aquilonibacter sp.]|nr:phage terminase large subunit family protein [Candidatus Aquilonibacter sp.]
MIDYASTAESLEALDEALGTGLALLEPPPQLTVSEWADRYAYLPRESSAQAGKWDTATAEYQRGFMDAGSDPTIERIVAMWGAQLGKTAGLLNMLWYYVHHDPSPILMVQPTLEAAENFSKERLAPAIRDTPVLRPLFGDPRSRHSGNTLLNKEFPGGGLALAGANSPAGLASRSRRVVQGDEVDKWEASAGAEGDPGKLMEERTSTFWNRLIVYTSTPSVKGASRIDSEYEKSDKRQYFVPCPHCGEPQTFKWANLKWSKRRAQDGTVEHDPDSCYYVCVNGCEILESDKPDMVRHGKWIAQAKSVDGKTAGFHLNQLYSPWVTWPEIIRKFINAGNDPFLLQTFVNSVLAETWELKGDRIEQDVFASRVHAYEAEAPAGVLVITAGLDVQKDRIEATAIGWGAGEESWALEHRIFEGDPSRPKVWGDVDKWLNRTYVHESGIHLRIRCAMVDSGDQTKAVYAFTRTRRGRKIYACKGRSGAHPILARPRRVDESKTVLYMVGVDAAKESFYARLKIEEEGPGYCHFPDNPTMFDKEFFAQIAAEQLITVQRGGQRVKVWQKRRERNEALDTRVYAMAALERIRADFPALKRSLQKRTVARTPRPELPPEEPKGKLVAYEEQQEQERERVEAEQRRNLRLQERSLNRRRGGGWMGGWRG